MHQWNTWSIPRLQVENNTRIPRKKFSFQDFKRLLFGFLQVFVMPILSKPQDYLVVW